MTTFRARTRSSKELNAVFMSKAAFIALSDEILLSIVETGVLSTHDICNLRATCTKFTPACTTYLQATLKSLYLHPKDTPLRRVVDICRHPIFSQKIEEVLFLGRSVSNLEDAKSHVQYWPRVFPTAFGQPSAEVHVVIAKALGKLPNLRRVACTHVPIKPGFNSIPMTQINSYAGSVPPPTMGSKSTIEVLSAILEALPHITHVAIEGVHTVDANVDQNSLATGCLHPSEAALSSLKSLRVPISASYQRLSMDWSMWCRSTVVSLHIAIVAQTCRSNALSFEWMPVWSESLSRLLSKLELPALRSFSIDLDVASSNSALRQQQGPASVANRVALRRHRGKTKKTKVSRADWSLAPRPITLLDKHGHVENFFSRHTTTLRKVEISNILLFPDEYDNIDTLPASLDLGKMTDIIRTLRTEDLEVHWQISRYVHHAYCPGCKLVDRECKRECRQYNLFAHLDDFERWAAESEVTLHEQQQMWDFALMRIPDGDL